MTGHFGDDFSYQEIVSEQFGLTAKEAALPNLHGVIHFMDAIINGQTQGQDIGD